jgi:hypothetical protein
MWLWWLQGQAKYWNSLRGFPQILLAKGFQNKHFQ